MNADEIKKIKVAKVKCDNSLLFFTRYFYKRLRGQKFILNWHHSEIASDLEKVQKYQYEYLGINIPPRMSKTELLLNFIARGIGQNPNANFLYITASDELRAETSVRIRDIINDEHFKIMYGVELKKDQNAKNLWRTTQGGGLKTATIFGQITGFGAGQMIEHDNDLENFLRNFEGCITLDDIDKMDNSEMINAIDEKVKRVLSNTVLSRKNSSDTPIINMQQRAGVNDTTAYFDKLFANNPKAKKLVLPIIINGVPLWGWKMPLTEIEALRTNPLTQNVFNTQFMQDPKNDIEGLVFPVQRLQRFKFSELKEFDANISNCDVADAGDCYLSHPFMKTYNKIGYVYDVVHSDKGDKYTIPEIVRKIIANETTFAMYESNNQGGVFASWIEKELRTLKNNCVIHPYYTQSNKETRINSYSEYIIQNFRFLDETEYAIGSEYWHYMNHLTRIRKDGTFKLKDAGDATASLAKFAHKFKFL